MDRRFRDEGKTIASFGNIKFVKCPRCKGFACADSRRKNHNSNYHPIIICSNCDYVAEENAGLRPEEMWLSANCCGHTLWAINLGHLEYIEKYVAAKIRLAYKNPIGYFSGSMLARLPKWMNDGRNRDEILKCIINMKATIPVEFLGRDQCQNNR